VGIRKPAWSNRALSNNRLIAVLPAYNEENAIAKVLIKTERHVDKIVVVDDGSNDLTPEIAKRLGATVLSHGSNRGKGAALRTGIEYAKGQLEFDVLITLDSDSQHNPDEIELVAKPILQGNADVVIGVRPMESGVMPRERIIGNKILDGVTNAASRGNGKLHDTQSGFRAYSFAALKKIDFSQSNMAVESQTLVDAVSSGLRIEEVPISTTYDGIVAKRSRASHFSQVLDYALSRTVAGSPLLYLGFPGLVAILLGVAAGVRVVSIFVHSQQIAAGTALISVMLIIVGAVMAATAMIIKLLKIQAAT
jgi:glycosyltransferase involved in cell wall biosynthesis